MRRFWDNGQDEGDIEARLRAERPEPSDDLVDRITGQLADGQRRREISKTRAAVAVVFASLVLMSGFGAAALAAGGGSNGGTVTGTAALRPAASRARARSRFRTRTAERRGVARRCWWWGRSRARSVRTLDIHMGSA